MRMKWYESSVQKGLLNAVVGGSFKFQRVRDDFYFE